MRYGRVQMVDKTYVVEPLKAFIPRASILGSVEGGSGRCGGDCDEYVMRKEVGIEV